MEAEALLESLRVQFMPTSSTLRHSYLQALRHTTDNMVVDESVYADLRYLKRLELYNEEKPFQIFFDIPEDEADRRPHNLEFEEKPYHIKDMRPSISQYRLDDHGFAVKRQKTSLSLESFSNRNMVEKTYLPEMEQLLRDVDSSIDKVFFFDWRVIAHNCPHLYVLGSKLTQSRSQLRSGDEAMAASEGRIDLNELNAWIRPNRTVHVG